METIKANCSHCNVSLANRSYVKPECLCGCYCFSCWKEHRCVELMDSHGKIVKLRDKIRHVGDQRVYEVIEIIPSFTVGQQCVGEMLLKTKKDGKRHVMRTRLMEVVR